MMTDIDQKQVNDILAFWLEAGEEKWFAKDEAFDADIRQRFADVYDAATAGRLDGWATTVEGSLALIIVLDQFSRNLFREDATAYAQDAKALELARGTIARGFDQKIDMPLRQFIYLPFQHSEVLSDQQECLTLYEKLGDENGMTYAQIHYDIIKQFGRFPHRNEVLQRETTAEESAFLESGGFSG